MRSALVTITALLLGLAFAQEATEEELNPYLLLETPQQIAEVVNAANSEILLSGSTVQHAVIAEALRKAMVERGVPVFILTTLTGANENGSYIHSLYLMGAQVRIVSAADPLIVVDRTYAVAGPLIARPALLTAVENETFLLSDPTNTLRLTSMFVQHFEQAAVFEYRLNTNQ